MNSAEHGAYEWTHECRCGAAIHVTVSHVNTELLPIVQAWLHIHDPHQEGNP